MIGPLVKGIDGLKHTCTDGANCEATMLCVIVLKAVCMFQDTMHSAFLIFLFLFFFAYQAKCSFIFRSCNSS